MEFMFWLSVLMIFYIYIGYPMCVALLALLRPKKVQKRSWEPFVTILIAAHNEAENIKKTIKNKLELNYPAEKLEIIVISDGSTDGTDDIVRSLETGNVRLIRQEPRAGKTSALNLAVPYARGDVIVFSDANSIYDSNAIKKLVANFADSKVGYVTGKMVYVNEEGSLVGDGCSAYMKYENLLRCYETRVGSVVGVDGGIDAVRNELYERMNQDHLPDFILPLKVVEKGYRVVYEPEALIKENTLNLPKDEYQMRVRVTLRALWALFDMRHLLTSRKNRLFAWQLWSHKLLRYFCFVFIILALISNLLLITKTYFYAGFFVVQIVLYLLSFMSLVVTHSILKFSIIRLLSYSFLMNSASAHAFVKFFIGKKSVMWTPRKG